MRSPIGTIVPARVYVENGRKAFEGQFSDERLDTGGKGVIFADVQEYAHCAEGRG